MFIVTNRVTPQNPNNLYKHWTNHQVSYHGYFFTEKSTFASIYIHYSLASEDIYALSYFRFSATEKGGRPTSLTHPSSALCASHYGFALVETPPPQTILDAHLYGGKKIRHVLWPQITQGLCSQLDPDQVRSLMLWRSHSRDLIWSRVQPNHS